MSDAARYFHETWLGMAQPTEGLVVSIPAMLEADAFERLRTEDHHAFAELLEKGPDDAPRLAELRVLLADGLGWGEGDELEDAEQIPDALALYVPEGPQTVRATAALRKPDYMVDRDAPAPTPAAEAGRDYRLLVLELPPGPDGEDLDFDKPETVTGPWEYPPAKKLERLLRESRVPIGVLLNRRALRLMYAPHGEAAGHIDFRFADMADVGGRPILDALVLLLGRSRIFAVAEDRQLHSLLARSRQMQAEVTNALSAQVFSALETLLRGFEAADARASGDWLRPVMELEDSGDRDVLFDALLTVMLRLVFLLYAEDSGLLPTENRRFQQHYSLYSLYERLEAERTLRPDAMSRRYSAWPGLLALFRVVYLGASHGDLELPAREGHLFSPHRFPFLEGFEADANAVPLSATAADARAAAQVPTVDDETVYFVLRSLIFLGGSRLSYRTLQVEQIGSVYEGLMGWGSMRVVSPSVRLKPSDSKTAPQWVSVADVLGVAPAQREKWLKTELGLKGKRGKALTKDLVGIEKEHDGQELLDAALSRLEEERVKGTEMALIGRVVIQPGDERKRTSSHYTPPELSGPIVARALEPLLACFGDTPSSEQILSLKVCDPAMGSGAFLVEACRFLADHLEQAWAHEGVTTTKFSEEDDLTTYARRQVAERCLYGVDKNPVAVELAKLSLWLVTLQKDKPFTFLDHSMRCGDSLVGCSVEQITEFHWSPKKKGARKGEQLDLFDRELADSLSEALAARQRIAESSRYDTADANRDMRMAMRDAEDALSRLRLIGDLLIGAFFTEKKPKARETERKRRKLLVEQWLLDQTAITAPEELVRLGEQARDRVRPFHWMLEFPEVFYAGRLDPLTGRAAEEPAHLDAVIGNPPFLGGSTLSQKLGLATKDWLFADNPGDRGAKGRCDLCAFFFRRSSRLVGEHGTLGLVATNTISQGDTRSIGLKHLLSVEGCVIYDAVSSRPWPGDASVTISTLGLAKGAPTKHCARYLDGRPVTQINSRLRPAPERQDPVVLLENRGLVFQGSIPLGTGFFLTVAQRQALIDVDAKNAERIFPYMGGAELNTSPTQDYERHIVSFGRMSLEEANVWPDLVEIVERRVKPEREALKSTPSYRRAKKYWWHFYTDRPALYAAIGPLGRCLATAQTAKHVVFSFQPTDRIFTTKVVLIPVEGLSAFAVLSSRTFCRWAWVMGSTMKTDFSFTSDCINTFTFPSPSPRNSFPALESLGKTLYENRATFMVDTDQGLTKTYNALKDPTVTARSVQGDRVVHLRELHVAMDHAVLEAYATETGDSSWTDIEIPPYTTPVTKAEKDLHQRFEDHVLDKLFELNAIRAAR